MKKFMILLVLLFSVLVVTTTSFTSISEQITYRNLYNKIIECNIKYPDIVFAQAVLETGHFKSNLFQNANNLFGMKLPKKRETVAVGKTNGGYARFTDWESSVYDYSLWQSHIIDRNGELSRSQYYAMLDKIYSKSKGYSFKVKKIINQHQEIFE